MEKDGLHPVAQAMVIAVNGVLWLYGLWCTVLAFVGGTLPVVGISMPGGVLTGLAWLFVAFPILATVSYWISVALATPVQAMISWLGE